MIKPITKIIGEQALTASIDTFTRVRDRGVRNDLARLHRAASSSPPRTPKIAG